MKPVFDTWQVKNILFTSPESTAAIQFFGDSLRDKITKAMHLKAHNVLLRNASVGTDIGVVLHDYVIMDACSHHGYSSLFYNSMILQRDVNAFTKSEDPRKVILSDVFFEWVEYAFKQDSSPGVNKNELPSSNKGGTTDKDNYDYIIYDQFNQSFPCARCCGISHI
jgi:hypothetical protein